jgi:hypothetical protein
MGRCLRLGGHVGGDGSRARARTHRPSPHSNRLPSGQPTSSLVRLHLAERWHSQDILLLLLPLVEPATALPCPPSGRDNVLDVYRAWSPHRISMARAIALWSGRPTRSLSRLHDREFPANLPGLRSTGSGQGTGIAPAGAGIGWTFPCAGAGSSCASPLGSAGAGRSLASGLAGGAMSS